MARIEIGLDSCIYLGNLDAKRDWGHAKDYVQMQWLMLQQENPEDFVIATGRMEKVRKFIEICSLHLNWNKEKGSSGIRWEGKGLEEVGIREDTNEIVIRVNPRYFRPTEVEQLLGDSSKAFEKLGWKPETNLEELIAEMIANDLNEAKKELFLKKKGFKINTSFE